MEQERKSRRCWKKFKSESLFAKYTPFIISLAAGKLRPRHFEHFISQDLHILEAFKKTYRVLAENCVNNDEDKMALHHLQKSLERKFSAYELIIQEANLTFSPYGPTVDYNNFLLDTTAGKVEGKLIPCRRKIAAYTLAAILPCMRLYYYLFRHIKNILDPNTTHIYESWIDHYSSQDFKASITQTEVVLEKLSDCFTRDEVEVTEKLYHRATKLQVDFFANLPSCKQTLVPLSPSQNHRMRQITICCDYDMTCTAVDSAIMLAEMPMALLDVFGMSSVEWRKTWSSLFDQRSKEFDQCFRTIISSTPGRQAFDYHGLREALEQVAVCEKNANVRAAWSRLLQGLTEEDVKSAASIIALHDGCRKFFQKTLQNKSAKIDVHIISYCWFGRLIRSVLPEINDSNVHSNELALQDGLTTGEIEMKVVTSFDKLKIFNSTKEREPKSFVEVLKSRKTKTELLTVCIGGDVGDLLCLLEADIGIVLNSSQNLITLGHHFGVRFFPLFAGLVKKQKQLSEGCSHNWKPLSGILYTVSCWAEIEAFIFGL